jgi:hypothetical protein
MSLRPTRVGWPCALKSLAPRPSTPASSRRRSGRDQPGVWTPETSSEAVSRSAPRRSKSLWQTPAHLPWLGRFPHRAARHAITACSRPPGRQVMSGGWRTARSARSLGDPQAAPCAPPWRVGAGPLHVLGPPSAGLADAAPGVGPGLGPGTVPPGPGVVGALRPCGPPAAARAGRERRSAGGHRGSRGRHGRAGVGHGLPGSPCAREGGPLAPRAGGRELGSAPGHAGLARFGHHKHTAARRVGVFGGVPLGSGHL